MFPKPKKKDITAEEILRTEYKRINEKPSWARNIPKESFEEKTSGYCNEEIEINHGAIIGSRRKKLNIQLLYDVNRACNLPFPTRCLEFHSTRNILCATGRYKYMELFKINYGKSELQKAIKIKNFPIYNSQFIGNGEEILLSSERRHFYVYNMEKQQGYYVDRIIGRKETSWEKFSVSPDGSMIALIGDSGDIPLLSSKSKQVIGLLTQGCSVVDVAFSPFHTNILYSLGSTGHLYVWDVSSRRCLSKIFSHGFINNNIISPSFGNGLLACGGNSGVLSLYDTNYFGKSTLHSSDENNDVHPVKEFYNLTTPISAIKFNKENSIMCYSSASTRKGIRMVDLKDMSVFTSWPFNQLSNGIGRVYSLAFSSDGTYLALGNNDGRILIHSIST